MPNVNLSPIGNTQFSYDDGSPADGSLLWTYTAGSTTPLTTYTSSSGLIAQTNPIVLNSLGLPTIGEVFLIEGLAYDIVWEDKPIFPATHGAVLKTFEDIDGINDNATTTSQWISSGAAPVYISASSFSLQGDQTTEFHKGRMVQFLVTAGTVYGKIVNSVFAASLTTVTMLMLEGGVLDSGLTTANLSFLRADHSALPNPIEFIRSTVAATATTTPLWDYTYGEIQDWTGVVTITALPAAPRSGAQRQVFPAVGTIITPSANISIEGGQSAVTSSGDKWIITAITTTTFSVDVVKKDGTAVNGVIRGYLSGFTMSTAGASTTISIAGGQAADSTNAYLLSRSASINKTTAIWAAGSGNGGLDVGVIAISNWYYFYEIKNLTTQAEDVIFSLSASAPALSAGYTVYRRIGAWFITAASQWLDMFQVGDFFSRKTPILDVSAVNPGTAAVTRTLSVPPGISVMARINANISIGATGGFFYLSDLSTTDDVPSSTVAPLAQISAAIANSIVSSQIDIRTNTSAQIRSRMSASAVDMTVRITTIGYFDSRGKDA